ncbi:unnamed protein product [Dovyalis caffra]|uniref:Uncharacterized protein n=1 Tax=Dovyalis caffra TaxID=77055 RepID=A0AAV1QSH4_9ROSI|nr:unnamed protein product [Dovyalis caffra]
MAKPMAILLNHLPNYLYIILKYLHGNPICQTNGYPHSCATLLAKLMAIILKYLLAILLAKLMAISPHPPISQANGYHPQVPLSKSEHHQNIRRLTIDNQSDTRSCQVRSLQSPEWLLVKVEHLARLGLFPLRKKRKKKVGATA